MKNEVINLPFIIEDFEVGDRVYFHSGSQNKSSLGTVWAIGTDTVTVTMDNDWMVRRPPVSMFQKMNGDFSPRGDCWGKCLPMKELEEGSRISFISRGVKEVATVKHVTDSTIHLAYEDKPDATDSILHTNEHRTIEHALRFWELEG